jgi:hypothetical protein
MIIHMKFFHNNEVNTFQKFEEFKKKLMLSY